MAHAKAQGREEIMSGVFIHQTHQAPPATAHGSRALRRFFKNTQDSGVSCASSYLWELSRVTKLLCASGPASLEIDPNRSRPRAEVRIQRPCTHSTWHRAWHQVGV